MNSSASVSAERTASDSFIGIMLMNRRRGGLEIVDENDGLLRSDELAAGSAAELADHLLVVLHVQRVLRFDLGQTLVKIAGAGQIAGLNAGMGQQFDDFADVRVVSRLC